MYAFPPPPQHTDKASFASAVRAPSAADHSTHSSSGSGNQPQATADRYLPSLLHTTTSVPQQQQPAQSLQQQQAQQQHVPVQGIQYPLNNILLQTAQFMAMNDQLRKEIEQYASLRVRAASLKGGPEAQVAAAAAAAYFLAPPLGVHHHAAAGAGGATDVSSLSSLVGGVHPFGLSSSSTGRLAPPPGGRKSPHLPDSYKTVMCQAWLEAACCSFGDNCRFAHGEHELRPMTQPQRANRKYKTKLCEKYTNTGLCPYGTRCLFIHPDNNTGGNNAYIRPDKLEELKKRQQQEAGAADNGGCGRRDEEGTKPPSLVSEAMLSCGPPLAPLASSQSSSSSMESSRAGGDGHQMMTTSTPMLMATTAKNTGKQPVAPMMSIGITPISSRPRQSLRPHPSWPLEPSHFYRIGGEEDEEEESETDEEHREMMQAAEAVAAEAAAAVLMNCGTSTDGRSLRGSCSSYASQPPTAAAAASMVQQQQHLPRAVSPPVFGGLDHSVGDTPHQHHSSSSSPPAGLLVGGMDCGTPCSGSGSSSGYLSESGCCGVITPASGLSSGTASPLDALMLSGGTHSLGSSPPSMLLDSGDFSLFPPHHHSSSSSSAPLGMTISLPPMSASGCWGLGVGGSAGGVSSSLADPFRTAFDIDKMAREMAKEFGGL